MSRKYWLDLFTGTTWEEFLEHGAKISGFRESRKKTAERISPGDYLLWRIPINVMSMVPIMESVNILTFSL